MSSSLIAIFCVLISFVVGYLVGRVERLLQILDRPADQPRSFLKTASTNTAKTTIQIDDAKYVAPIDTAGLSKSNSAITLGKTTKTQDDIQTSVSKLAQLKGK